MVISFGLEAHILTMASDIFWRIISRDIPGPNKNEEKAQQMRTFLIPNEYIVEGSSDKRPRTIRILAAFISEKYTIVVCDFVGLARMHVESRHIPWTKNDFLVGSQVRH